ncbi:MAG: YARHG domain-containing protein [Treponema sp.]|nr:YARHG domain-containing protein [Treponema sp.]
MKSVRKFFLFFICLSFASGLYADEHELNNVPKDFIGTYMPVQMEMLLREYMSYEKALYTITESSYDILSLEENICYSQVRFSDGYAVYASDFEKWSFVKRGEERFILDENGLSYRRISPKKNDYDAYAEKVLSIIFVDALHNKNISISGSNVTIYGKQYHFDLSPSYVDDPGALYMSGCVLKIEGLGANIYTTESTGKWTSRRTNKIVQSIPLFYWNDENYRNLSAYPYRNSKKDLRLLRNLIYAKNGYKFSTEEFKNIFSDFDWYKPSNTFSEDSLNNFEKILLDKIKEYENKKSKG